MSRRVLFRIMEDSVRYACVIRPLMLAGVREYAGSSAVKRSQSQMSQSSASTSRSSASAESKQSRKKTSELWNVSWGHIKIDDFAAVKWYQKVNHFPG